ncbi:MAG: DUF2179 domain-containing protein [Kiritimatiellae bacterium]|jgi:uncharacterized protein YebE (UPF0316 family)|nr:DUF2179 domain-containing protein [Kiritimatiellia bacterium]
MSEFDYMAWVVIPILIFVARLMDVSLATVRQIMIMKGMRKLVPIIAFVEVLIWLVAITQVMQSLSNIAGYLGWALGFAGGNYLGMVIEEKVALGHQVVRIITQSKSPELQEALTSNHYGLTKVPAQGSQGPVDIFFVAVERKRIPKLLHTIRECDPDVFYTVEDIRSIGSAAFPRPLPATMVPKAAKRK